LELNANWKSRIHKTETQTVSDRCPERVGGEKPKIQAPTNIIKKAVLKEFGGGRISGEKKVQGLSFRYFGPIGIFTSSCET